VHQNVSMAFAWPANDTAAAVLGRPTEQLSWTDSPLIFQFNLTTGKTQGQQPYGVSPLPPPPRACGLTWRRGKDKVTWNKYNPIEASPLT